VPVVAYEVVAELAASAGCSERIALILNHWSVLLERENAVLCLLCDYCLLLRKLCIALSRYCAHSCSCSGGYSSLQLLSSSLTISATLTIYCFDWSFPCFCLTLYLPSYSTYSFCFFGHHRRGNAIAAASNRDQPLMRLPYSGTIGDAGRRAVSDW
jgi:hypothetical protein